MDAHKTFIAEITKLVVKAPPRPIPIWLRDSTPEELALHQRLIAKAQQMQNSADHEPKVPSNSTSRSWHK